MFTKLKSYFQNVNWKIRFQNKAFWVTMIPAFFVLLSAILAIFGISPDFSTLEGQLIGVVDALFSLAAIVGVNTDMTTPSLTDSERALERENLGE